MKVTRDFYNRMQTDSAEVARWLATPKRKKKQEPEGNATNNPKPQQREKK